MCVCVCNHRYSNAERDWKLLKVVKLDGPLNAHCNEFNVIHSSKMVAMTTCGGT